MVALRRLAKHCYDREFLDVESSLAAQWCLKSLQSSIRELRIASSVVKEDQLNLILVKLVEYLGHASIMTSATAFTEIMKIAQSRQITPRQLLEPFWRYLAFSALKDYIAKPKLIRLLSELMSMNVPELIIYIHSHAMPWLVLTKKQDVIQKIAEVRGEEESWQPCLDNANLGPILALLMVQEVPDVPEFSMALFRQISSHFDALTFVELLQVEPLVTTLELLKAAGDADEQRKPHISACLLTAMSQDELRPSAFSCWAAMLLHLEEEDVEALIETTFFLIGHYWASLDTVTQDLARGLIETLLTRETSTLEAVISKLPSFSHINSLADVEAKLNKLRKPVDNRTAFFLLGERICHDNSGVVLQALRELASYLQKQQGYLQASAVSEQPDSVVTTLTRALLDCASKYNGVHGEISSLCTQCIGLVGCLDPNRVDTVRAERQIVVKSNFEESGETTDFVVFLLEHVLVKSFLSATDAKLQGFLSFAMQQLLERCDIGVKDISISEFLLPYVVLHIIISDNSSEEMRAHVLRELLTVLQHELPPNATYVEHEDKKLYCEAVFRILDYASRWIQAKRAQPNLNPADVTAIKKVQIILDSIPAELISQRAVDCKAYSRALFHLEQHIRQVEREKDDVEEKDRLLQRLQDIYTQIDEPDGLEGISAHLHVLDINQQILSHRKAGRWAAAQTWYEIKLAENPDNIDVQIDLLTCLKESGQHDVLLNYVEGIEKHTASATINRIVPYQGDRAENFNVSVAQALLYLQQGWTKSFVEEMKVLRERVSSSMTFSATSSLQTSHEPMLKCHVLTDLDLIAGINNDGNQHLQETLKVLNRRLEVLGSYVNDKQYALGIRRAAMELMSGETAKLVIENYIRSLNYGTKYLYQTLPRILTLWLEMGAQIDKAPEGKVSLSRELYHRRKTLLDALHKYLNKYINRLPAYIFYTALPQVVARIAHPNLEVFMLLQEIIFKVVEAHPRQALWSLFAIMTKNGSYDLKSLLRMGEKLADQLLLACNNGDFQSNRTTMASITRDLGFNHKCTPCPLVVPIETCLTATLPTLTDNVKKHKAFSRDVITIDCFLDDVMVLGSLAKPRKLTARGSNGVNYGLLIKPKDDLRTDQRLMEFNSMINRSLKRDAESSRRQLYIRTYAVTPLNEECGIIEWVSGLKTLRDILLNIYRSKGVVPNYGHLAAMMKDAATGDKNTKIFTDGVLGVFPPVLPQWFISQFPNPTAWFAARLRYTRSCAVMSMVGTILGLGDRHGENVLLEEGNGGIFHVDFNCLFDKGLTFAQPERVPFRLTHNMVAAMGIHGSEGPFRKCSELTLSILRQQEETLMTILEAFIYDPTLDLQKDKKRKNEVVRLNPQSVVDNIKRKVRGLLPDESIPLGVEGQVEELIKQAVNPKNLAAMYIGWCPFL
ncbi:putative protein kinase rad3 protein [Eutypa lata UCREL1]|uniref:non-specific serine/threonine protein kinase n=1 Tax=Eutypa lata (strain UCR-EL1) TaxID=1287681 RepID=M7TUG7_EUTLA|nr:putative protein kinase rad3 protein [Eutypa lata UCREL1]